MTGSNRRRVLIIGAGEAGRMVASEIASHPELGAVVAGYLDDDPRLAGGTVEGSPVLGRTDELERIAVESKMDEIIIAVPTAPGRFVRQIMKRCRKAGIPFKIVPGVMEIIRGTVRFDQIRELRAEDLLGRETVEFDLQSARRMLGGKRILVTGAGGTIGGEICRQLALVEPAELILLGRGENRIFDIEEEMRARAPRVTMSTVISDLRDAGRTDALIDRIGPHVIYHTAAHKHVHYMERDPAEAVLNNIKASVNLLDASERHGVGRLVFISTDKAANPCGVMGATKRVMELLIRQRSASSGCRMLTVRFGNVIGSTGSVVPLFIRQANRGGPVTVSDPRATRYFMTVKEASLLVIRASVIGKGGELYILDMGDPLNILEVARDIIALTGHEPESEIPIIITGLREGEKLHEELTDRDETLVSIDEQKLFLAQPSSPVPERIEELVSMMIAGADRGDGERVRELLAELVPDLKGSGGGLS